MLFLPSLNLSTIKTKKNKQAACKAKNRRHKPFRLNFLRCQFDIRSKPCSMPPSSSAREERLTNGERKISKPKCPVNELLLFNHGLIDFSSHTYDDSEIKVVRLKESEQIISTNYIFLRSPARCALHQISERICIIQEKKTFSRCFCLLFFFSLGPHKNYSISGRFNIV